MKHYIEDGVSGDASRTNKLMSEEKMGELKQSGVSPDRSCISTSDPETLRRRRCRAGGAKGRREERSGGGGGQRCILLLGPPVVFYSAHTQRGEAPLSHTGHAGIGAGGGRHGCLLRCKAQPAAAEAAEASCVRHASGPVPQ